ncbi:unnamed protein product [Leuciscus chuanchicus]
MPRQRRDQSPGERDRDRVNRAKRDRSERNGSASQCTQSPPSSADWACSSPKQTTQRVCIRGAEQKPGFQSATPDDSLQVGEVDQTQVREMVEKRCLLGNNGKLLYKLRAPLGHSHW